MGSGKSNYKPGRGQSPNGNNGSIFYPSHWSDNITVSRPKKTIPGWKLIVFLFDLIIYAMLLKFLNHFSDAREALVWIVAFLYGAFRMGKEGVKFFATYAKNKNIIRKLCKDFRNND